MIEFAPGPGDHLRVVRDPEAGCYLVRFLAGPSRAMLLEVTDTDMLPLPYTSEASPVLVVDDLTLLMPGAEVEGPQDEEPEHE